MKKMYFSKVLIAIAIVLFGGIAYVNAASTLPDSVVSDGLREVEFIENFPVIVKTANNGKYYIYCMNLSATYGSDIKFDKAGEVDPGFIYILNNRPQTSNKDKDFYITQLAVWYYDDYLNNNNFNLVPEVKKYIIAHRDSEEVSKKIYDLYEGAKNYKQKEGRLEIEKKTVTFTEKDGYLVSNELKVYQENLDSDVKYSLTNAPKGSQIVEGKEGVYVRVPVNMLDANRTLTVTMHVQSSYKKQSAYHYFYNSKYQKVLFQDPLDKVIELNDSIDMKVIKKQDKYEVSISKTDVTQSNEVPGASLVVKDAKGNVVESWVSTDKTHKMTLAPGEYSLTETIAPKGYKLSKTTIYFLLDEDGAIYVKNINGNYVAVDRVIMINELIDVISVAKRDSETNKLVAGAKLVIKDSEGKTVKEFTTDGKVYQIELLPGEYSLSEVVAPKGYVLSKAVIYFMVMEDGTLKVKNVKGEYVDSAIITFYNDREKEEIVNVPATGKEAYALIIGGFVLLIGGAYFAKKTIKEC